MTREEAIRDLQEQVRATGVDLSEYHRIVIHCPPAPVVWVSGGLRQEIDEIPEPEFQFQEIQVTLRSGRVSRDHIRALGG